MNTEADEEEEEFSEAEQLVLDIMSCLPETGDEAADAVLMLDALGIIVAYCAHGGQLSIEEILGQVGKLAHSRIDDLNANDADEEGTPQ